MHQRRLLNRWEFDPENLLDFVQVSAVLLLPAFGAAGGSGRRSRGAFGAQADRSIEQRIGKKLLPTYSVARTYTTELWLTRHVDRAPARSARR